MGKKKYKNKNKNTQYKTPNTKTETVKPNEEQPKQAEAAVTQSSTVKEEAKPAYAAEPARTEVFTEEKKPEKQDKPQKADPPAGNAYAPGQADKQTKDVKLDAVLNKEITSFSPEHIKAIIINALKILLPVAACAIVIAVIISAASKKDSEVEDVANLEEETEAAGGFVLSDEPLEVNAHPEVNELMRTFYTALADGDMDTIKSLRDYNDETEVIRLEKKSDYIESYENITCYTKPGVAENSYFVYVVCDLKVQDSETMAPGLTAYYVYPKADGSLIIDGNMEESITAALILVTNQDEVVDLYNKVDVSYKEALASDETLSNYVAELPAQIKISVGEALAQLETQNNENGDAQTEASGAEETQEAQTTQAGEESPPQNETVNQTVKATDTVNVRSSDSEEADKIGKVTPGTELARVETRANGWSKVIFEGKEAYIKSDYLEVVTTETVTEPIGTVTATTNVNVRSKASQDSDKYGTAQAGNSYNLLEDQGEWLKIDFNGKAAYVKAEFFEK